MKTFFPLIFAILAASVQTLFGSTNLPPASTAVVSVNATTLVIRATGLLESNAIARVNQPAAIADITFETNAWVAVDETSWTNAAGWSCAGVMTNGILDCDTNAITSPLITGPGLRSIAVSWSNLYLLEEMIEWSTNGTVWTELETATDLRETWPSYRIRVRGKGGIGVPGETPIGRLARLTLTGHRHPALIGSTNDCAGIVIRVDNPVGTRDAVNLQTLNTRLAEGNGSAQAASNWSSYVAATPVNYAGQALILDPRYTLSITNDTLSLTFGGQPIYEIIGGGTVTPMIVSFAMEGGTNITLRVTGAVGWRPYPEWCGDLLVGSWTRLTTNQFQSSYPNITNGQFSLSFVGVTNSPAYYRTVAVDETGGTNILSMAIRVPLQVDGAVTGQGMANYATTQELAGAVAPLVTTQMLGAAVAPLTTTQTLASTVSKYASLEQSNTHSPWTTQRVDAIEVLNSWVVTNITITTNLIVSGSGDPSPNGTYAFYTNALTGSYWTNTQFRAFISYLPAEPLAEVSMLDYAPALSWTNATLLGNYYPDLFGQTNPISGVVTVAWGDIVTNVTYTTNRTVALRLLPGGIESQGTNASWRELSLLADISTNDSGAVTGRTYQTIRYLGAP